MKFMQYTLSIAMLIMMSNAWVANGKTVPLAGGSNGIAEFSLVPMHRIRARLKLVANVDDGKPAIVVTFTKYGDERRLLALEARLKDKLSDVRAIAIRYRIKLSRGKSPRLAVLFFDADGGIWFKRSANPLIIGKFTDMRLPVSRLRQVAFSDDPSGKVEFDKVDKVWLGLLFDGPAKGRFEISRAQLTNEPFKPTEPLRVTGDTAGEWRLAKDPAVKAKLSTPNEGPDGKPCMKFEFTFPGGRHMFALPIVSVPDVELEGYSALRFTYKATLPAGISGLLVCLWERDGSQYYADPPPPPSERWRTVTIPLKAFKLGSWSKDENQRLDVDQIASIVIGAHGTATEPSGKGIIWAVDIQLVP